ncbi:MAG: glycosyltransferase involved in cell wall biosynthesis [Candidatus Endobugula sp.]|jgi:glycosyltransferase involved in cell wall biosynthesis
MAKDYSLQDHIVFHGWVAQKDISPLLVKSRGLVLPSLYECGGAVVLEAMACSVAVVATNWGGPAGYIDSDCGILVEPTSRSEMVNGFSDAILLLASDSSLAQKMGQSGRQKIEEEYDWEKKVDEVFAVYQQVLSKA